MSTQTQRFDAARYLKDDEDMAELLQAAMDDGDVAVLAEALGALVRARGVALVAQDAGLQRETLYKALRSDAQPRMDTIVRVLRAVGLGFRIVPLKKKRTGKGIHSQHAVA
jgi:probable addiction module antidote protein